MLADDYKPPRPYYPRMTPNAKRVMTEVSTGNAGRSTFERDTIRKNVARKLLWDGWIKLVEPTAKKDNDLRLTADGRAWLEREKTMHDERVRRESIKPPIKIRYT